MRKKRKRVVEVHEAVDTVVAAPDAEEETPPSPPCESAPLLVGFSALSPQEQAKGVASYRPRQARAELKCASREAENGEVLPQVCSNHEADRANLHRHGQSVGLQGQSDA